MKKQRQVSTLICSHVIMSPFSIEMLWNTFRQNVQFLCAAETAHQPIRRRQLRAFFLDAAKPTCWSWQRALEWGKKRRFRGFLVFLIFHCVVRHSERASPWGSRMRGMLSSLSARRKASSRFSWLLLDRARERSTSCGLREHRMARKASPLLQLDPKSLTLTEQATLGERRAQRTSLVGAVATAKCQKSYLINFLKVQCVIFVQIYDF